MKIKKFVSKLEKERDLMATVIYIYTEIFESPDYWGNVDNAMDLAKAFIVKYPTGTDWEYKKYTWEERLYEFVKKHHKLVQRNKNVDKLIVRLDGGLVQQVINPNEVEIEIRDYDMEGIDEDRDIEEDANGKYILISH